MHASSDIELTAGTPDQAARIAELVWSTGPASYSYIFGARERFDRFVGRAWQTAESYFGHTEATVALRGGEVVGVEIGFDGARNYRTRANMTPVGAGLIADGTVSTEDLIGVLERAEKASYLNPYVPDSAYYVLALAVMPDLRGSGLGARLLRNAFERGRRGGCAVLHLDVLSDNPAVGFYRAHGLVTVAETVAPEPCREHGVPMEMRMVASLSGGHS
ncbi:MAG: GNAT family N-acetyltransferase [Candidatus Binatia bacterium]